MGDKATKLWAGRSGGSKLRNIKKILLFPKRSKPALGTTQPPVQLVWEFFFGIKSSRIVKLTTHLHLVPRLKMGGIISLLPLARL